jgi:hypothetical protein
MAGALATRWASQAAQDALLRYNPQRTALAQQIREAGESYGNTVRAARVTGQETQRAAQRALPAIAKAYSAANAAEQPGATLVSQELAAPGVNPNLRAGASAEVQQAIANLASMRQSGEQTMIDRGVRGREGAQFAQLNAQNTLQRALSQLFSKGQTISQEQGAFAQSEAEKLAHEAETLEQRERASQRTAASAKEGHQVTERGQNMTARTARENREAKEGKGSGKGYTAPGVKELTVAEHNKARDTIEQIRKEAYEIRGEKQNYNQAKGDLETPIKTKAFSRSAYANNGLLKAGLDLAYFGGIGTGTLKQLHQEGFSIGKLGYPVYRMPAKQPNIFDAVRRAAEAGGLK